MINEKEFILADGEWAMYPVLPVKRRKENTRPFGLELGVIHYTNKAVVYQHASGMYGLDGKPVTPENGWTEYKYESIDALLADGWVVD